MKGAPHFALTLVSIVFVLSISTSCKKEVQQTDNDRAVTASPLVPANPVLSGVLGTGHNIRDSIRLTAGVDWRLSGLVYLDSADLLIIDPGTTIKGNPSPVQFSPGGGLIICRGAKIIANGTVTSPIVFTSAAVAPQPGDWSGIVILGNAPTNHSSRVSVEGISTNPAPPADITFGGPQSANSTDNSGVLRYVRIEYAGYTLSADNEMNGLTLAGVGNGTIIDFVEVFKAWDDAFQFFGGTVNAGHIIAADPTDDMFETGFGYRGTIRYALGLADTTRAAIHGYSNGIESENDPFGSNAVPMTKPVYRCITIIGLPNQAKATNISMPPSNSGEYGRAVHLRRNTEVDIDSAIFMGFQYGIALDSSLGSTPTKYRLNHTAWLRRTFTHAYYSGGTPDSISAYITEGPKFNPDSALIYGIGFAKTSPWAFLNYAVVDGNRAFRSADPRTNFSMLFAFWRSAVGSMPVASNFMPSATSPARRVGAFPNGLDWTTGAWVRFQ